MLSYFLKRLFLFIPILLVVSVLIFLISKAAPGDPISNMLESNVKYSNPIQLEKLLKEKQIQYGLDLPLFYISIHRQSEPEFLSNIVTPILYKHLESISYQNGNPSTIEKYYSYLNQLKSNDLELYDELIEIEHLNSLIEKIENKSIASQLKQSSLWRNYILKINWNGTKNQYHRWIAAILNGDFGTSYQNNIKVKDRIVKSIKWTISLSTLSLIISFLIAIPSAVYAVKRPNSLAMRFLNGLFFAFYASPTFVVASILLLLFASGEFFNWFPNYGIGYVDETSGIVEILGIRIKHLLLPIFCWTYGSIAYLYRQMYSSLNDELAKDYILTAKSKGLSLNNIHWKQALRNSLVPMITILGAYFPILISGSFIIEYIFALPGMGSLTLEAFYARDYPILFSISLLASFATILGAFIADILYHFADPRWQLKNSNSR